MPSEKFTNYLDRVRTMSDLSAAASALHWDQETYMPHGAAVTRAEQLSTIETLLHQMSTSDEYSRLLEDLQVEAGDGGLEEWERAALRESARLHRMQSKLPESFVREQSKAQSLAQHAWKRARGERDFSLFSEALTHLVDLKRREAGYYGYAENPYDALIDIYEPGMTAAQLDPVFDRLREGTKRLLGVINSSGVTVDDSVLHKEYDKNRQLEFATSIVKGIGFDFNTGRVDLSAHPFCTSFGITDVRLTTRIFTNDLRSCLFGLIHEAGHGMYEQGFDSRFARTPLAGGISMGIHESQSLFWENMIGRSEAFWQWAYPQLRAAFPDQLAGVDQLAFFKAINVMKPSFIRVEADELTYNLHIILRFQIENALINGQMEVADIPEVWNAKMTESLGITPDDDAEGCLQDVHWSFGGFGYFPSYTLGKLYAAMLYNRAAEELDDLPGAISRGEFSELLGWLRTNVHRWGKSKTASELVMEVCGAPLSEEPFLAHVERKIARVYA